MSKCSKLYRAGHFAFYDVPNLYRTSARKLRGFRLHDAPEFREHRVYFMGCAVAVCVATPEVDTARESPRHHPFPSVVPPVGTRAGFSLSSLPFYRRRPSRRRKREEKKRIFDSSPRPRRVREKEKKITREKQSEIGKERERE